ncbi:hypothetical protein GA0115257_108856 [Streptomyces sp. LcepLS]|nr:hypothetical protein GA0115257_108856 [Streptomyces sp. LcepLS]
MATQGALGQEGGTGSSKRASGSRSSLRHRGLGGGVTPQAVLLGARPGEAAPSVATGRGLGIGGCPGRLARYGPGRRRQDVASGGRSSPRHRGPGRCRADGRTPLGATPRGCPRARPRARPRGQPSSRGHIASEVARPGRRPARCLHGAASLYVAASRRGLGTPVPSEAPWPRTASRRRQDSFGRAPERLPSGVASGPAVLPGPHRPRGAAAAGRAPRGASETWRRGVVAWRRRGFVASQRGLKAGCPRTFLRLHAPPRAPRGPQPQPPPETGSAPASGGTGGHDESGAALQAPLRFRGFRRSPPFSPSWVLPTGDRFRVPAGRFRGRDRRRAPPFRRKTPGRGGVRRDSPP